MKTALLILLLCTTLFAIDPTVTQYSFTITSANAAYIAASEITAGSLQNNYGVKTTCNVGKLASGGDQRTALRFEKLIDSIRTKVNSDTGTWVLDSGRVILNCYSALGTDDSVKIGIIRLKTGRLFVEGVANNAVGYGITYDSCVAKYTSGETGIDWTTNGAAGSNDTVGGIIDSSALLGPAAPAAGGDISWKIRTVDLADTTNYSGWLLFTMWYGIGTTTATSQRIIWSSDDNTTAGDRPILNVYLTNTKYLTAGTTSSRRRRLLGCNPPMSEMIIFSQLEEYR